MVDRVYARLQPCALVRKKYEVVLPFCTTKPMPYPSKFTINWPAVLCACVSTSVLTGCDRAVTEMHPKAPQAHSPSSGPAPVNEVSALPPIAPLSKASVTEPKKLPLAIQGVAPAGLTVRIKGVEIGGDATVLDVSVSFANRITNSTMLALADTYLEDESGARLHIKRPENNRDITLREGETLEGQLVFMGSVPVSARAVKLVFNDGNDGDNIVAPGLTIKLPLRDG